jgi:murein L,D-transpeptidase YcbB/YkuD
MIRGWVVVATVAGLLASAGGATLPGRSNQPAGPLPAASFALSWSDSSGRPTRDAREAVALLVGAGGEGLYPADYDAASVERLRLTLETTREPLASDIAAFDAALTANMLRYLRDLHLGRVDPRAMAFRVATSPESHDFAAILGAVLSTHRIADIPAEWAPTFRLYRDLRRMLARYRALAGDRSAGPLMPVGATVRAGERYGNLHELQRLLIALEDMPGDRAAPSEDLTYGGATVEAVKHFQVRHGLQPDGVLGRSTQAALGVPLSWRVRQIELALERLRWLPDLSNQRLVAVNIPMFRIWAWDSTRPDAVPALTTGAIVGRVLKTRTPIFDEEMRYLVFRPYWNIPASILRHEILPALARDPAYFDRHELEIVSGQQDDRARPVPVTEESLAGLRRGTLRVRQRPGAGNSLGLVKFVFPNDAGIYLHGTPAPELFSRPRRDFSHGCVRVEDPVALAEWALKDQPDWNRERILAAMNGGETLRVNLTHPIEVLLFYITAVVMPEDGTIRFAEDIYGYDAELDRVLTSRQPGR